MRRGPLGRYFDWATQPARRMSARFWLSLPLLSVVPLFVVAVWAEARLGVDRPLILAALLPIPVWGVYLWYRATRAIAPHLHGTRSGWTAGWRAALALVRRGRKSR